MPLWASSGSSASRDSHDAGRHAASAAANERGAVDLALVFSTAGHDQAALLAGVAEILGDVPVCGCTGAGVIGQDGASEASHAVRVLCLGGGFGVRTAAFENAGADPALAAETLAAATNAASARLVLLFPDGLGVNIAAFLRRWHDVAPGVPVAGGAAGEMLRFERTWQLHGRRALSGGVVAVALSGPFAPHLSLTHGCEPLGIEHVVTRSEGAWVHTLDDRPAWHVMREYLESPGDDLGALNVPFLALSAPEPRAPGERVIRVPLSLDRDSGALFFPGELRQGETVMMMRRHRDQMKAGAVATAKAMSSGLGAPPIAVLQFDCAGRGRVLFGDDVTAALVTPVQDEFGRAVPWVGFHCYGEIASIGGIPAYHNYTCALLALTETDATTGADAP